MVWIIVFLSSLVAGFYLAVLIMPLFLRKAIDFFCIGNRIYLGGLLKTLLGLIFLTSSAQTRFWSYTVIFGLLLAASGLSSFFFPLKRTKQLLQRMQTQSALIVRLYAVCCLAAFLFMIYAFLPAVGASLR